MLLRWILIVAAIYVAAVVTIIWANLARAETASWYQDGEITASGERFDPSLFTCASRTIPRHTVILVRWRGRVAPCRINDYGPAAWTGRDLDVSRAVARRLGMIAKGVAKVTIELERLPA